MILDRNRANNELQARRMTTTRRSCSTLSHFTSLAVAVLLATVRAATQDGVDESSSPLVSCRRLDASSSSLSSLKCSVTNINSTSFRHLASDWLDTSSSVELDRSLVDELDLSGVGVVSVDEAAFAGFVSLRVLRLSHNRLDSVHLNTLFSSSCSSTLVHLDLSHNQLTSLPLEAAGSSQRRLARLHSLNLSHNRLRHVDVAVLLAAVAPALHSLDLADNLLTSVRRLASSDSHLLAELNLSANRLTSLAQLLLDDDDEKNCSTDDAVRSPPLRLNTTHNEWTCECIPACPSRPLLVDLSASECWEESGAAKTLVNYATWTEQHCRSAPPGLVRSASASTSLKERHENEYQEDEDEDDVRGTTTRSNKPGEPQKGLSSIVYWLIALSGVLILLTCSATLWCYCLRRYQLRDRLPRWLCLCDGDVENTDEQPGYEQQQQQQQQQQQPRGSSIPALAEIAVAAEESDTHRYRNRRTPRQLENTSRRAATPYPIAHSNEREQHRATTVSDEPPNYYDAVLFTKRVNNNNENNDNSNINNPGNVNMNK